MEGNKYQTDGHKLERESHPQGGKPDKCPKCNKQNVSSCPGGSSLKMVPGIWWKCEDCHHEW
jgi:hypothetical protein